MCAADYEFPASKPVSEECKDILSRILVADPAKRITIAEIQARPCHPVLATWRGGGSAASSMCGCHRPAGFFWHCLSSTAYPAANLVHLSS